MLSDTFILKIDQFWANDFDHFVEEIPKYIDEIPITISRCWILRKFCRELSPIEEMCHDIISMCNKTKSEIIESLSDLLCAVLVGNNRIKMTLSKLLNDEDLVEQYESVIIDNIFKMDNYSKRDFIIDELIENAPCDKLKEYCQYLDILRYCNYCNLLQSSFCISVKDFYQRVPEEFDADDNLLSQIIKNDLLKIAEIFSASKSYETRQPYDRLFYEYVSLISELELEVNKHICSKMIPIVRAKIKSMKLKDTQINIKYEFESYNSSEEYEWVVDFSEKELVSTLV
ncbi:MAG: hypothetical protein QM487_04155 [Candidatus Marithrix sp.]